jgi:hypothetical protein
MIIGENMKMQEKDEERKQKITEDIEEREGLRDDKKEDMKIMDKTRKRGD